MSDAFTDGTVAEIEDGMHDDTAQRDAVLNQERQYHLKRVLADFRGGFEEYSLLDHRYLDSHPRCFHKHCLGDKQ